MYGDLKCVICKRVMSLTAQHSTDKWNSFTAALLLQKSGNLLLRLLKFVFCAKRA